MNDVDDGVVTKLLIVGRRRNAAAYRGRVAALLALALVWLLAACDAPTVFTPLPPTPTPLKRTRTQERRPTVAVKRGTIVDAIQVLGRVAAAREAELFFTKDGRIRDVTVESGQMVKQGDILAQLETGDLALRIAKAQAIYDQQQLRLAAAQAKVPKVDIRVEEEAVRQAQLNLQQAKLALEVLRVGPTESDVKSAEAAVASAQAALERARSDVAGKQADLASKRAELAARMAGPTPLQLTNARAKLKIAQLRLQQLVKGPREEDLRAAQIAVDQAKVRVAQLRDAPKVRPEDLENARLDVEKAKITLEKATIDMNNASSPQTQAAVRAAQISLEIAQNAYAKLQSLQPTPWELRLADEAVAAAEANLAKLQKPNPYDVQQAELAVRQAQAELDALMAGPSEQELAPLRNQIRSLELSIESAKAAIPSAQANLAAAQAKLAAVRAGPSEYAIRQQEHRVALASNALVQAQAKLAARQASLTEGRTTAEFDVQSLQKVVEQARLDLEQLQVRSTEAKLIAPFGGIVTRVNIKPGDSVTAYMPQVFVSDPTKLILKADIPESDLAKVAVGQKAEIRMEDLFPGQLIEGTVTALPAVVTTRTGVIPDRSTKIDLTWPGPGAELGMLARVRIVVEKRENVLIVPTSAIRRVGKRQFVEYMDGSIKRSRNVTVGLRAGLESEVTSGVKEGMVILAGR